MKNDAVYFPHFSNARNDRKIRRVTKELGIEGYGIYFMILEILREQPDMSYPVCDIDLLADEFGTSEQKVRAVVTNYGLFSVDESEEFFSAKLIEYLEPMLARREQAIKAINARWEKERQKKLELNQEVNTDVLLENYKCNTKKRKEKKRKEKETNISTVQKTKFDHISLKPESVSDELWSAFIENRRHKKLQNTELALKTIVNAFEGGAAHGFTYEQMIVRYVSSNMQRFKHEWMKSDTGTKQPQYSGKTIL